LAVTRGQSSVRNGEAGKPSLLKGLQGGLSAHQLMRHMWMRDDDRIAVNVGIGPVEFPVCARDGEAL